MMKSVCLLTRRSGSSRADFQAYYEANHAPLAIQHFPFRKYVRNHLLDGEDLDFDTVSEFWADDLAATAGLMEGPVGEVLRADERRFMDQSMIRPAGAAERLIAGPPRGMEDGGDKTALFVRRAEGVPMEAFVQAAVGWGAGLGSRARRVTMDEVSPWTASGFPADAILWLWGLDGAVGPPPADVTLWRHLDVRATETPPDALLT
jgi:uncharacterized protein (TIGR02118 family)